MNHDQTVGGTTDTPLRRVGGGWVSYPWAMREAACLRRRTCYPVRATTPCSQRAFLSSGWNWDRGKAGCRSCHALVLPGAAVRPPTVSGVTVPIIGGSTPRPPTR
ncbi:hypothetical protein GCM10014715_04930 [Streptomyces spiralis]|uniref:Uncharacterized protein n=1 Tax=Streptomyces spiralis TaxID=66376 RepID=A0A919DL13_9ACTN|nr:hypothetical protein GCM10014715_04930 [Streptomyces spiralis]